jgi:hypothetical protein
MNFSSRMGFVPVKDIVQINSIDDDLLNSLWNIIYRDFWEYYNPFSSDFNQLKKKELIKLIWIDFFKKPVDYIEIGSKKPIITLKLFFLNKEVNWYKKYDFLEFIANNYHNKDHRTKFMINCNKVLQREMSAYRFVDGILTPINSEIELIELEKAINLPDTKFAAVSNHLKQSLRLLSDKQNPDYKNSIKESISAIESLCKIITNNPKATLGQALKEFENNGMSLHPSLKGAFDKLYGYTSDEKGIRHAHIDESDNVAFEEANYMLITCSSFSNYLISKFSKIN